ncbi:SRPBCC family protein [Pseudoduganella chitinolytica]|uniref:SRPBCC family protein n=1 Tax=Pseudoduganella chitinolytica TaxID=34070 RepID=A0ABY8B400_9BURK|nr:SRPBCC family protein [Pseudoduganella chitinolytica]WEF30677.1 SRPBCC family protein [Pseudoduganella chitinolytica]
MRHACILAGWLCATRALAAPIDVIEEPDRAPGRTFTATTTIDAPPERLCRVVQDYASYGAFMPNTRSAVPVGAGPGYVLVDMTLDLPLGQVKQYRLRLEPASSADSCRLAWQLVPRADLQPGQTIADTTGYWEFSALADGDGSLVRYRVYADPGPVPFGFGWIVEMMSKRSLPKAVAAVRERALGLR